MRNKRISNVNKNTSVRKRAIYVIAFAFISFIGFSPLVEMYNGKFFGLIFIIPVFSGLYLLTLRCPKCGNRIYKRKAVMFGETFNYWGGFVPKRCSHCNHEL